MDRNYISLIYFVYAYRCYLVKIKYSKIFQMGYYIYVGRHFWWGTRYWQQYIHGGLDIGSNFYIWDQISLYKSGSESVCLFGCLFPNSSKTVNPSDLKFFRHDSPWDAECFRLKNIRIRRTVSRKIKKQSLSSTPSMIFIPFIYHFSLSVTTRHSQRIW